MAGKADFYADGQWNGYCDFCGAKVKSSDVMRTWNNFYVCKHHRELRNPQDFLRGVRENQSLPWTRPQPENQFVGIHYTRYVSDAVRIRENVAKSFTQATIAESIRVFESLRVGQTELAEEVLSTSESFSLRPGKILEESASLSEAVSLRAGKTLSDSVETLEAMSLTTGKGIDENVAAEETVTITLLIRQPNLVNGNLLNTTLLG